MSNSRTSLTKFTTFGINAKAKDIIVATSPDSLAEFWRLAVDRHDPVLILGEGSNVLF